MACEQRRVFIAVQLGLVVISALVIVAVAVVRLLGEAEIPERRFVLT